MGIKIDVGFDSKGFGEGADAIKKKSAEVEAQLSRVASIAGIAFAGFGASIGLAVKEAAKFEDIGVQFEVLTGDVKLAQKTVEKLANFAASTPFEFEGIAKAGQQLLGFGFSAEELVPKLEQIGDVAAAIGKPIDEVGLIFGQVSAAGKLTGERLLQFQERAIPIGPAIAKTLGVAESAVKDLVSKGAVDFATFEKAFSSLSQEGGFAFEGLAKKSKTFNGVISTLKDNFSLFAANIGKEFLPAFKEVGIAIIKLFQFLSKNKELTRLIAIVGGLTTALVGLVASAAATGLAVVKLAGVFKLLKVAVQSATISTNVLKIALKSLIASTVIGAVLVGLGFLIDKFVEFNEEADDSKKSLKELRGEIKSVSKQLKEAEKNKFVTTIVGLGREVKTLNPNIKILKDRLVELKEAEKGLQGQRKKGEPGAAKRLQALKEQIDLLKKSFEPPQKKQIDAINKIRDDQLDKVREAAKAGAVSKEEAADLEVKIERDAADKRKKIIEEGEKAKRKEFQKTLAVFADISNSIISGAASIDVNAESDLKQPELTSTAGLEGDELAKAQLANEKKLADFRQKEADLEIRKRKSASDAAAGVLATTANKIASSFGAEGKIIGGVIEGVINLLGKSGNVFQKQLTLLFEALPQVLSTVLQSLGPLIDTLLQLIQPLFKSILSTIIPEVVQAAIDIVDAVLANVPGLLEAITIGIIENLPVILLSIAHGLQNLLGVLVERAPEIIAELVRLLPIVSEAFSIGLVKLLPSIAKIFILSLVFNSPLLALAIAKAIFDQRGLIATAFVSGFTQAFSNTFDTFDRVASVFTDLINHINVAIQFVKDILDSKIQSFQEGGFTGGGLAMLHPNEFIIPEGKLGNVIAGFNRSLNGIIDPARGGGVAPQRVLIGFDGVESSQVLTARQNEDRALGISRESA